MIRSKYCALTNLPQWHHEAPSGSVKFWSSDIRLSGIALSLAHISRDRAVPPIPRYITAIELWVFRGSFNSSLDQDLAYNSLIQTSGFAPGKQIYFRCLQCGNFAMDEQLNNSTGGGFNPDNASINQTRGDLTSETNPPFHPNSGHRSRVHPGPNFSSEMPYLGQPYSGSYPSLTPFGPSPSDPCVYLGPASDPSYTSHFSYFTRDGFYIPGANGYPQFANHISSSFSWSTPEVFDTIYVPASNIPGPPLYIATDADAGLYLYAAGNISSGIGQQASGFIGQSSHDANVNNNNTVPASYGGNVQPLGYGHVASSSGHDYRSARTRPTGDRGRSRAAVRNRGNARDDERQIVTGRASNFLPDDLSDFYGDIRPNYEPRNLGVGAQGGLPDGSIAYSLAEFMFVASEQDKDEKTCSICLEDWKNMARMARVKTCGHEFHVRCIREWLKIKGICPVCRTKA